MYISHKKRASVIGGCVFVFLLAVVTAGCSSPSVRAQRSLESGKHYFERQKFAEASIEFQKSLQRDPQNWESRYYLALSEVKLGELREAYRGLNAVVELRPSFVPAHLELADLLLLGGKTDEARKQVDAAQLQDPKDPRAQALLARSYLLDKDFPRAIAEFEKAKQLSPTQALVWGQSGLAETGAKQYSTAERDFRRAIELDPENPENYRNVSNLLQITGRSGEIESSLRQSVDAHPKSLELSLVLADFYFQQGRVDDVDDLFAHLKSRTSELAELNLQLGDFWMWRNDPARAAIEFEAQQARNPSLLVQKKLISAYLSIGRIDDAERLNQGIMKKNPHDLEGRTFTAALAYFRNDFSAATQQLEAVLKDDPKSLFANYYLGLSWMALQKPEQAKSAFFNCVGENDKFVNAYLRLGELALQAKDGKSAVEYAKKSVDVSPRLIDGYLLLAQAYMMNGDLAKAESIVKSGEKLPNLSSQFNEVAAQFYALKKNDAAATAQYEQALRRTSQPFPTLTRYTDFLVEHGHVPAAIERVKQSITQTTPSPDYYELLASLYLRQQDLDNAEPACRKALELNARLSVPHFWLGEIFRQRDRPEEALRQYDEAIRLSPKEVPPYIVAGNLLVQQGQHEKAKGYFERALNQDPNSTNAQFALAHLYGEEGQNLDLALSMAQELKKNLPQDPQASDLLGWIYYQKGVYRSALDQLQLAAQALPDVAVIQYHLGMTYSQIGERQKARQALKQALKYGLTPQALASEAEQQLKRLISS